ncbi:hypothetical protein [Kitasatospora terrestris]|uniref:Uncharacterized protein n=1 Tax=Kitasatospora terrestris TaxID=258051 RepID=A0ABP9DQZ8_9ACTN
MAELRRAAFFDLREGVTDSAALAADAMIRHREAGDLVVHMVHRIEEEPPDGRPEGAPDLLLYVENDLGHGIGPEVRSPFGARLGAVVEFMARLGLSPTRCFGYGDHLDAAGMLCVVGNPRVLGQDPEIIEYARERGWPTSGDSTIGIS